MRWWRWLEQWWRARCRPLTLGERGERAAARYLRRRGYILVARGQRDRLGEVDLVAVDGRTVVFVEVKTRTALEGGHPAEAVDREKQRRLSRVALGYLQRHDLLECPARFDVVAVTWPSEARTPCIEHIRHAFDVVGRGSMFS